MMQINMQESKRFFSSENLIRDIPQFITGFTDAEGCFNISIFKDNTFKLGWRVKLTFKISLHSKDKEVLELIKNYLKVGGITKAGPEACQFRVSSVKDLAVIINHFDKYPLITKKFADYELFKQAFNLIINKEHVKEEGLRKIIAIKASMNLGNSVTLKETFPGIVPVIRPSVKNRRISDAHWLAGFTSGEGSFYINIKESPTVTTGYNVVLVFQLVQHSRDEFLIKSLVEFFKCGNIRHYKEAVFFRVEKFSDIITKIIPFFNKYPIEGVKSKDFQDWCRVALLVKDKKHLTEEGLESIRLIKAGINRGRSIEESETDFEVAINPKNKTTSTLIHKRGLHTNALSSNIQGESSNRPISQPLCNLVKRELSGEYIAGFVQADGSFSAVLTRKTRGDKEYFNISLVFTIVQTLKYKELILEIQRKFGGIGHWYINKKDKSIRYQVTSQSDLLNVIIPFFMKHQLRSGKLLSFLRFKYILEVMSSRAHWNNKKVLLSLIVVASHMNPLGKLGNKIRYLTPDEQKYVINNIQPEGVDISKLTDSIRNFKQNKLTLEFIHGLFESNTNNFRKVSVEDQDYIRENYLPKNKELWRFKEYYSSVNPSPAQAVLGTRHFSSYAKLYTKADMEVLSLSLVKAVKIYKNADLDKPLVIKENKGKSGIYRWTNLVNGKSYIGSSVNLGLRFTNYYTYSFLSGTDMVIYKALLKYGYSNFSLEILEYCDVSEVISREQYYLDLLNPDYNVLKTAGSSLGYKHSEETRAKLKARVFSLEHKSKLWTPEHRANHLEALKTLNSNEEQRKRASEQMKMLNLKLNKLRAHRVEVLDTLTNETEVYSSIREAAWSINVDPSTIQKVLKSLQKEELSRLIKKRYKVKK
jgi:group I intron endonuclease